MLQNFKSTKWLYNELEKIKKRMGVKEAMKDIKGEEH